MARNLILSGGIFHPFDETSDALASLLRDVEIKSEITDDIEGGLSRLADYDMVTFNCLRWRMIQAERHAPYRDEWAMELSARGRQAITEFLARGGAILGLHTASICFDTWPEWRDILGAVWNWDKSFHPEISDIHVDVKTDNHAIVSGMDGFQLHDEVFHHLTPADSSEPLLSATMENGPQPLVWAREVSNGRVVYDALGHGPESIGHPAHSQILKRSALWALRRSEPEVAAI